ncbi:MAG: hypothetical protein KTR33_00225 [Gammaproteobacteria bacterium]|nr:hypothetical protein [Gammaproteobacteria bacterium]
MIIKGISIKSLSAVAVLGGMLSGAAFAGSNCNYGDYSNLQAKVPPIESSPIMADAANVDTSDPAWLAMLERQRLEAESQQGTVVVPN